MPDDEQSAREDRAARVIWSRVEDGGRGRRAQLTHAQIARVGVEAADADGLEAVSMRRVARELGVGTMSLYRYVATRAELLELMYDAVMGEMGLKDSDPDDWRNVLTVGARQMRRMVLRHPWIASRLGSRSSLGPNTLAWLEESISLIDRPGLSIDQMLDLSGTVTSFTIGFVQDELADREAQRVTGMDEQQWRATVGPYLLDVLATGKYPYVERIVIDAEDFPDVDKVFERRLAYVIEGLAAGLGLD